MFNFILIHRNIAKNVTFSHHCSSILLFGITKPGSPRERIENHLNLPFLRSFFETCLCRGAMFYYTSILFTFQHLSIVSNMSLTMKVSVTQSSLWTSIALAHTIHQPSRTFCTSCPRGSK